LILPVKKSDLEKPLAGQIYSSVEEICKAYKSTQMVFEEYLGFSLANVDQTELTARVGATLNQLGVTALAADNFSFTYNVVAKGIAEVAVPAPVVNEPIVSPTPEPVAPVQEPIVPATLEPVAEPALEEKVKQAAPKGDPKPLTGQIKPAPSEGLDGRTYISSAPELHQALDSVRNDILAAPDLKYDIVAERFQVVIKDFDLTDGTPKAKGKMAGYIANRVKRWNLEATAK
jgi:hypothetical protein